MKKFLFNEDGTIKMINMIMVVIGVLIIAGIFIYLLLFKDKNITEGGITRTSKNISSTINMCKDCSMKFNDETIVLETNQEYQLSEMMAIENISIPSIKFVIGNTDYFTIEKNKEKNLVLKTKDIVGESTLRASYDKISVDAKVIINAGDILSLSLLDHPYYIYLNKESKIEIDSNPKGIDITQLNFSVSDENIVSVHNGMIVGKMLGSAKLYLAYNDVVFEQDVYVVNDLIDIKRKKGNQLESIYKIKVDKKEDIDIIVTIDDNSLGGLTNENLVISHIDEGISGVIEYDGKNLGLERSYKYRITINELQKGGKMTIVFKHPDGTFRNLILYNESE